MPFLRQNRTAKEEQELQAKKEEVSTLQELLRQRKEELKVAFIDGAITRTGLERELLRLDRERRNTNPVDQHVQSLIQGQQNEILHLLGFEKKLLTEQANLIQRLDEAQAELQTLIERKQRRSKDNG